MDPLTFEAVSRNPELIRALMTRAHRERAEAVHRLIVEPIMSLFSLGDHHALRLFPRIRGVMSARRRSCTT